MTDRYYFVVCELFFIFFFFVLCFFFSSRRRHTRSSTVSWALGDVYKRQIYLSEVDLESWNVHLNEKYEAMKVEQRADLYMCCLLYTSDAADGDLV